MRYIVIATYAGWHTADISQRFYNEVCVCNLLNHRDMRALQFLGVYSTAEHPMALIYEYMDGLDLKQHLMNDPNAEKLKLVIVPCTFSLYYGSAP